MPLTTTATPENRGAEDQIYGGSSLISTRVTKILPQEIRNLYQQSEMYRTAFSANWFLNIAFYMGFQNVNYSLSRREFSVITPPAGFMVVANRILPAVRAMIAQLTKNKPTINAIAPIDEISDVNSAEITEALMEYWYRNRQLQEVYEELVMWMVICGTSFAKLQWNPSIGPQQTYQPMSLQNTPIQPMGMLDGSEQGLSIQKNGAPSQIFQGEVDVIPLSPFEVHTIPYTMPNWQAHRAIIHASIKHVDWIADNYEKGNQVAPESSITIGNFYQQRIRGLVSPDFADFIGAGDMTHKDHAILLEYREKKSRRFPKGRQIAVSNGIVLEDKDQPYSDIFPEHMELGYVPVQCMKVPGRFWSIGLPEPLRPLQVEYNKVRTEIVKNRITVGRNKILAPNGSGITEDDWANLHGLIINYNKGFEPHVMPASPLPAQTENELNYNIRDMDDVSGIHEISRGENPTQVKSGLHANILIEADNSKLGPIVYGLERSMYQINLGLVAMAKKYYTEKRTIKIVGDDNTAQVYDFYASDLTVDLELVPGSAFPRSRAAEQQTIVDLWKEGLFVNRQGQPDYRRVFQLLRLGGASGPTDEEDQDRKNQNFENAQMIQYRYLPPRDFDDHIVHVEEVDRYMKRQDFRFLSPKIQALFQYHKQQHMELMLKSVQGGPQNAATTPPMAMPGNSPQPNPSAPDIPMGGNGVSRPRDRFNRRGA